MNATLTPENPSELAEVVRATPRLLPVGAQTKSRLSAVDCEKLSTLKLTGIVEYDPSEFTFTALAGTPLRDIVAALAERGQYLPFDPMLVEAGSTLGGTVAAGVSGPGRFRFGGVRDFILGIQFVDGAGRLLRMGGKVVKNAAGFDLPKFFVGSLGRFGMLTEITFKVFPQPVARLTLKLDANDAPCAVKILTAAANSRWEVDALDWLPDEKSIYLRLAGPAAALESLAQEILNRWTGKTLEVSEAEALWTSLREFGWVVDCPPHEPGSGTGVPPVRFGAGTHERDARATTPAVTSDGHAPVQGFKARTGFGSEHSHPGPLPQETQGQTSPENISTTAALSQAAGIPSLPGAEKERAAVIAHSDSSEFSQSPLIKIALAPGNLVAFSQTIADIEGARTHISSGGNMAFVSLAKTEQFARLNKELQAQGLSGLTLRGKTPLWIGNVARPQIALDVKKALDAENRFPGLDD